jgi:hypothetical protein
VAARPTASQRRARQRRLVEREQGQHSRDRGRYRAAASGGAPAVPSSPGLSRGAVSLSRLAAGSAAGLWPDRPITERGAVSAGRHKHGRAPCAASAAARGPFGLRLFPPGPPRARYRPGRPAWPADRRPGDPVAPGGRRGVGALPAPPGCERRQQLASWAVRPTASVRPRSCRFPPSTAAQNRASPRPHRGPPSIARRPPRPAPKPAASTAVAGTRRWGVRPGLRRQQAGPVHWHARRMRPRQRSQQRGPARGAGSLHRDEHRGRYRSPPAASSTPPAPARTGCRRGRSR